MEKIKRRSIFFFNLRLLFILYSFFLFRKVKTKEEEPGGKLKTKRRRRRSRGWIEKERGGEGGQKNGGGKVFIPFGTWKVFGLGFSGGRVISFVVSKCLKFHSPQKKKN